MTTGAGQNIEIGASAVNTAKRLFWCERYGVNEITNFFDAFGEDTDDPEDAVMAIVKIHPACWLNIDLRDYTRTLAPN